MACFRSAGWEPGGRPPAPSLATAGSLSSGVWVSRDGTRALHPNPGESGGPSMATGEEGDSLQVRGETEFKDVGPWRESEGASGDIVRPEPQARTSSGVKERVLKMSSLIDQQDESELLPPDASEVDKWYQNFKVIMGAPPDEAEEPTASQLAALHKKVYVENRAPYCDFSVWTPFERRMSRIQKRRTFIPLGDGSYLQKDLPGPGTHGSVESIMAGVQGGLSDA